MANGYIKIFRRMQEWEWYKSTNTKALFLHILLKANWEDGRFMGYKIPKGSFVTSIRHLAQETGLSVESVRIALNHLIATHEITRKTTNKFTIISVANWESFQCQDDENNTQNNTQRNKRTTNKQQTNNNNIRNKEYKKGRILSIPQSEREYTQEELKDKVHDPIKELL